jgi:hypothetical protein
MDGWCERRQLPNTELEKLGEEGKGQEWMKIKNQERQGPLWAVAPLLMMMNPCLDRAILSSVPLHKFWAVF